MEVPALREPREVVVPPLPPLRPHDSMNAPCEIHRYHRPRPLTSEAHHVLPQAWQKLWKPRNTQRDLWHPETIRLCPTGHRSVHEIIVAIMHAYERGDEAQPDHRLSRAIKQVAEFYGPRREFEVAMKAPTLWLLRYGGSLDMLVNINQYGWGLKDPRNPA